MASKLDNYLLLADHDRYYLRMSLTMFKICTTLFGEAIECQCEKITKLKFQAVLAKNYKNMKKQKGRIHRWSELYPDETLLTDGSATAAAASTNDFDVSDLYVVARNLIHNKIPIFKDDKWGKPLTSADIAIHADLERIRQWRNCIAHTRRSNKSISDTEFNQFSKEITTMVDRFDTFLGSGDKWKNMLYPIVSAALKSEDELSEAKKVALLLEKQFEDYQNSIKDIITITSDNSAATRANTTSVSENTTAHLKHTAAIEENTLAMKSLSEALKIRQSAKTTGQDYVSCGLPVVPEYFVGREKEMKESSEWLTSKYPRLYSIIAGPGVGKTTLACAIGHKINENHKDVDIIFCDMREKASVCDFCLTIFPHYAISIDRKDEEDNVQFTREAMEALLKALSTQKNKLLIIDNVEDILNDEKEKDGFVTFVSKIDCKRMERRNGTSSTLRQNWST